MKVPQYTENSTYLHKQINSRVYILGILENNPTYFDKYDKEANLFKLSVLYSITDSELFDYVFKGLPQ